MLRRPRTVVRFGGWLTALLAGVAGLLVAPRSLLAQPAPADFERLRSEFQRRGYRVIDRHPRCDSERDLFGLYTRGRRYVVVCQRGNRSETLLHEGWHLVQSLCLRSQPWLNEQSMDRALTDLDRRELSLLVQPSRWRREAEARAMAYLNPLDYFAAMDRACQPRP